MTLKRSPRRTKASKSGNRATLPEIVLSEAQPQTELASLVERTFSTTGTSPASGKKAILDLEGMSGRRYRLFVNSLLSGLQDARYLEIGPWTGSTFCSAIYGNVLRAVAIDNWSEFGGLRETFFANLSRFRGKDAQIEIVEKDFREVDFTKLGRFNVYFFDGPHQEQDHFDGLRLALPALDERFVFIVDDWNWNSVRSGTLSAIDKCGLSVEFSISVRTTLDDTHPDHDGFNAKVTDWHNGYFIAVLKKPGLHLADETMSSNQTRLTAVALSSNQFLVSKSASEASILVGITFHYVRRRLVYLLDVVLALADFPVHRLDIVVLTNTLDPGERASISDLLCPMLREGKTLEVQSCPGLAHPFDLAWSHKQLISDRVLPPHSPYNHFVYLEDDIRFGYTNFCYYMAYRPKLAAAGVIPSFVRTEFNLTDGKLYATDYLEPINPHNIPTVVVGGYRFCNIEYPYCGLYVLDRELAEEYVASPSFHPDRSLSVTDWDVRERAAMGLCWERPQAGFLSRYVVPIDLSTGMVSSPCWVTHVPGSYANQPDLQHGKIPINQLTYAPSADG